MITSDYRESYPLVSHHRHTVAKCYLVHETCSDLMSTSVIGICVQKGYLEPLIKIGLASIRSQLRCYIVVVVERSPVS